MGTPALSEASGQPFPSSSWGETEKSTVTRRGLSPSSLQRGHQDGGEMSRGDEAPGDVVWMAKMGVPGRVTAG